MEIKIKGTDIKIVLNSGSLHRMDWEEMRELEKAINIIKEIQKTTNIQNIELTV